MDISNIPAGTITANQLALIYAIIASRAVFPDEALANFGVKPAHYESERERKAKYRHIGEAVYFLNRICGVSRAHIAALMGVDVQLLRRALVFIGYRKDGRLSDVRNKGAAGKL